MMKKSKHEFANELNEGRDLTMGGDHESKK